MDAVKRSAIYTSTSSTTITPGDVQCTSELHAVVALIVDNLLGVPDELRVGVGEERYLEPVRGIVCGGVERGTRSE